MRKYFLILLLLVSAAGFSQTTPNIIYGKEVVIQTRDTSSAELTIKNSTRNVLGYFKNIGGGKGQYVIIPQNDITGLPDSLLARYTKAQADSRFKTINYVPAWIEITDKPANFSTTHALSNDIQDSLLNKVSRDGSYANPSWITSLDYSKLTGTVPTWNQNTTGNAATVTNGVYTTGSYANPSWITELAWSKVSGAPAFITGINSSMVTTALGYTPENLANKGVANGYADLDASGKIPASRIDFGQIGQTFVVASQAAMLAVSGANVGALAVRTDENKNYRLIAQPASTLANWQVLLSPDAPVQSVNGFTGNVNLLTTHISEGSNYWWTAARSRAAQSLTTSGSSGAATYDNTTGVLNIPTYTLSGLGGQPALSGTGFVKISGTTISYDNSTYLTTETDPTIYSWAKAASKPSYSWGEITGTVPTWNQNTTGNAATVTNGVYTTGSYANPSWITSLDYSKLTGTVPTWNQNTTGNAATVTNGVYTTGSYANPSWITSLDYSKLTGTVPTWNQNTTGNAATATSSTYISAVGGSLTTQTGTGTLYYSFAITNPQTGLFPSVDNSNSIITINRHPGDYYSQLGFSSNGNIYYRSFSATAINTTQSWQTLLTNQNYNSFSPSLTGSGATGTWAINISGTASTSTTATTWSGAGNYSAGNITSPDYFMTYNGSNWGYSDLTQMRNRLSTGWLGSYAYRSSGLAELSGASFSGGISATTGLFTSSLTSNLTASVGVSESTALFYVGDRSTVGTKYISFTRASSVTDDVEINAVNGGVGGTTLKLQTGGASTTIGGNLGVGVNSPIYRVDIQATDAIRVTGSSSGYTQGALILNSSTTNSPESRGLGIYSFNEGTDATWYYGTGYLNSDAFVINRKSGSTFQSSAASYAESSNFLTINNIGNVGFGTISPTSKLEVFSQAASANRNIPHNVLTLTAEQDNAPYFPFGGAILFKNRSYISGMVESSRIRSVIYDNGGSDVYGGGIWFDVTNTPGSELTTALAIKHNSNIGIGTTNPLAKLHVNGDTYLVSNVWMDFLRPYSGNNLTLLGGGSNTLTINGSTIVNNSITSTGFIKSGSSDSYFLLGGGGHVLTSNYATASDLSLYVNMTGNQYEIAGEKTFLSNIATNGKMTAARILGSTASYTTTATISSTITTAFCSGSGYTLTLPSASGVTGQILTVISNSSLTGITLSGVEGGSFTLICNHSLVLVSNGTTWKIASSYQNSAACS